MVLSDRDLRRRLNMGDSSIVIDPLDEDQIQPASVDLTLDSEFLVYQAFDWRPPIRLDDIKGTLNGEPSHTVHHAYTLHPGQFCLASTAERVEVPDDLVARVEGKSSIGRLGLLIHATAGYIDPGFKGKITLEMFNLINRPIVLTAGKSVCQISFLRLSSKAEFPYGHEKLNSKYQDQTKVTASLYAG